MLDKRRAKKAEQGENTDLGAGGGSRVRSAGGEGEKVKDGMKGGYRQREAVDRAAGLEKKGMDSVLGSVFG